MYFPRESGMFPVSLFWSRWRASRDGVIAPVKSLNDRSRKVRFLSWLRNVGIGPVRLV